MIGFPELLLSLVFVLVPVAIAVYLVSLVGRLVRAVERIADRLERSGISTSDAG